MLLVTLHLTTGETISGLTMSRAQYDRLTATLNQRDLPTLPYIVRSGEKEVRVPWRSIAYTSSKEAV